jgi:hypothetical protein
MINKNYLKNWIQNTKFISEKKVLTPKEFNFKNFKNLLLIINKINSKNEF